MPNRAHYVMVDEADPQWVRFWSAYEKRVAKMDARKAWSELNPSPELVDRIVAALDWQFRLEQWTRNNYAYAPYPASYLRAERWTDEPPASARTQRADDYGHIPPCRNRQECIQKVIADGRASKET